MNLKAKQDQYDTEKFLEDMGFEWYEFHPHKEVSVYIKYIDNTPIYRSVRRGNIVEGNLLCLY